MDLSLFTAVHSLAGRWGFLDWLGVFAAEYLPYVLGFVVVVFVWRQRGWLQRAYTFLALLLTALLSRGIVVGAIQFLWYRSRPFEALHLSSLIEASRSSFPSGHVTLFFTLAFVVLWFDRRWGWWLLGGATVVALARIFVGVHWPSDVLAGFVLAFLSSLAVRKLVQPGWLSKQPAGQVASDPS